MNVGVVRLLTHKKNSETTQTPQTYSWSLARLIQTIYSHTWAGDGERGFGHRERERAEVCGLTPER